MQLLGGDQDNYFETLKKRAKKSHVYREYQASGLELAYLLSDLKHKALYIRLAKQYGGPRLIALAKDISEKKNVLNKGAYFMKILKEYGYFHGKE